MTRWIAASGLACVCLLLFSNPARAFVDLTGVYKCDGGGTFYVRTLGEDIFWYAKGNGWEHVFHGKYKAPNEYVGRWADVPSGPTRNSGALTIRRMPDPRTLVRVSGAFGCSTWTAVEGGGQVKSPPSKDLLRRVR